METRMMMTRARGDQHPGLSRQLELHFRDQLRAARTAVLQDAEAFPELLFAFERLGALAAGRTGGFAFYKEDILAIASRSPLARNHSAYGSTAESLFELVRKGRNEALHQGFFARHLAAHAVELSLIVEDGLVNGAERIGDLMVRTPVRAEPWHPISHVRHDMLLNSFSYLPLLADGTWDHPKEWYLVSDLGISRFLRSAGAREREERLLCAVQEATTRGLILERAQTVRPDTSVSEVLQSTNGRPFLVVEGDERLVGIATPFDLL
jgi:CBS domain-containing protein